MTQSNTVTLGENTAETMRKTMEDLAGHAAITNPTAAENLAEPTLIEISKGQDVKDLTQINRAAAQFLKPARRKGTARLDDLRSLIDWAIRFKGPTSTLFAKPDMAAPTLTCVADYHDQGPIDVTTTTGDPSARHCHHRAVYNFPLSDEWKLWMNVSGKGLEKDDMGEFIEAQAKDVLNPTPAMLKLAQSDENEPWENRLIATAQQIEGRFGSLGKLLAMSRRFQVYETSDLTVKTNRDTGEAEIQFLNEHKDADGKPLSIPNLIVIAIPVFKGGAPYRMTVRFRYRKTGGSVKFTLTVYNPEKAFEAAFEEAIETARTATDMPLLKGTPEA